MKAILSLALLIISAFATTNDTITESTPAFIVGTWFLSGTIDQFDPPGLACCMPYGTMVITPDYANASQTFMTANVWKGDLCSSLGINSTYNMTVSLPWNKTWIGLDNMMWDYSDGVPNPQGILFQISDLSDETNFVNGTQEVEMNFWMDYTNLNGRPCGIIVSKDTSPVSATTTDASGKVAFHYGVSGLVLFLLVSFMSMF